MSLFIIGDVHGCLQTFRKLLKHWNPEKEFLVQLGDLIDRGAFTPETLLLAQELLQKHPEKCCFLRGNHEQMMMDYLLGKGSGNNWLFNGGSQSLRQFQKLGIIPDTLLNWLQELPLKWENEHVLVSHAGIAAHLANPMEPHHPDGILWNRRPLRKLDKIQVIGHTPLIKGKAEFTASSNSWNIDTGAFRGVCLTGIKLNGQGHFKEEINIPTVEQDLQPGSLPFV